MREKGHRYKVNPEGDGSVTLSESGTKCMLFVLIYFSIQLF
jgi:hypothetical protein